MLDALPSSEWSAADARHLLNRAGFGGSPAAVDKLAQLGFGQAVHRLLHVDEKSGRMVKPAWAEAEDINARIREMSGASEEEKRQARNEFRKRQQSNLKDFTQSWLEWMRQSPDPLREKMTLFLHGHLATSQQKVQEIHLLWLQNELFRNQGLGDFRQLTKAVSRDPAMLIYLDGVRSKKGKPNENFAREVMELFTLGEGNYSEQDVMQAALAFTGYRIDRSNNTFRFNQNLHDDSMKQVFGKSRNFSGDEVIDLIFEQPAAAKFLSRKLWEYFVYENPEQKLVERLAVMFRNVNFNTRRLLEAVFRSREFYSERALAAQIKSPVQWLVQATHELQCDLPEEGACRRALQSMGQILFRPPNVKGWDGGRAWINSSTLLVRYNVAAAMTGAVKNQRKKMPEIDYAGLVGEALDDDAAAVVDALGWRFYGAEPGGRERQAFVSFWVDNREQDRGEALRGLTQLMLSTPRYQLC